MNHTKLTDVGRSSRSVAKLATVTRGAIFSVLLIAGLGATVNLATPNVTTAASNVVKFVEVPSTNVPVEVDPREQQCLASNIYFEARDQSDFGQLAVGIVTLNRARHENWGDTVCGVVYQSKQFSWTHDKKQNLSKLDEEAYLKAMHLASRLLYGDFDAMLDVFPANHYHNHTVRPSWTKRLDRVAVVQDHVFYTTKDN